MFCNSVNNVCALLQSQLPNQYRIYHQFKEIRNLKSKLASDECMLQIVLARIMNANLEKRLCVCILVLMKVR